MVTTTVSTHEGQIVLRAEILIRLPYAQVHAILTDFEHLPRLNADLKAVQVLARRDSGAVRMRVVAKICIFAFCLEPTWVQEVEILPDGDILAVIDPDQGGFVAGWARWHLCPSTAGTRVTFHAGLSPGFWFPPLIGPWLIKDKLTREALVTAQGVERVANTA